MTKKDVLHRLGQAVLVLFITYTVVFLLLAALPSDGVMARYADTSLGLSLAEIQEIREAQGADEPLIVQYFVSLGGLLTGNLGYSTQTGGAVSTALAEALPGTLALAAAAIVLSVLVAGGIALLAQARRFAWVGGIFRALPGLMISLPSFWVGVILIQVVSFQLGWVPVVEPSSWESLILPAITLSVPIAAPLAQVLIRSIDDAYGQPYVRVVRARGAGEAWVMWRNVMRAALLPTITMAGLLFGELVGGAVVTEAVFGRRGLGAMTVDAVAARDTPVLLAVVMVSATAFIFINLVVDLLYPLLDARLRRKEN